MLTGKRVLKVLCGSDNAVFNMQKNWSCFGNGFVDIDDMFVFWKNKFPEQCFLRCKNALILKIREKKRPATEESCKNYFSLLNSPGLAFLTNVFFLAEQSQIDPAAKYADWTHRPLHSDLVQFSASESFFILKIFYSLYEIVRTSLKS